MKITDRPFEILLAEDNPADIALVRRALKGHDVNCLLHVVKDGAQAIDFLMSLDNNPTRQPVDLILLDLHLPKRNGDDVLDRIRLTESYAQTPVIVMSSLHSDAIGKKTARHTAAFYFQKASTLEEFMGLGALVRSVLFDDRGKSDPVPLADVMKGAGPA